MRQSMNNINMVKETNKVDLGDIMNKMKLTINKQLIDFNIEPSFKKKKSPEFVEEKKN